MREHAAELPTQPERRPELEPRIYVASFADYNAGRLHGEWLDAAQSPEDLHAAVSEMLDGSREPIAEEWAIHDYEGFGPVNLSEYQSLESVSRLGLGIQEHGAAFAAFASLRGDLDEASLDGFEESYLGRFESVEEYAEQLLDDVGATHELERLPEWLQSYVKLDVDGFANDLVLGGDIQVIEGEDGIHVFDGRS